MKHVFTKSAALVCPEPYYLNEQMQKWVGDQERKSHEALCRLKNSLREESLELGRVVIRFTTEVGEQLQIDKDIYVTDLDLKDMNIANISLVPLSSLRDLETVNLKSNAIGEIDLGPLWDCTNMRMLILSDNQIETVNLAPLSRSSKLQALDLSQNRISSIDLSPLSDLRGMKWLYLSNNQLGEVNLMPLVRCARLQYLVLANNNLTRLDLSPLARFTDLRYLLLNGNHFTTLNISSIFQAMKLEHLVIDEGTELTADSRLKHQDYFPRPIEDIMDSITWI